MKRSHTLIILFLFQLLLVYNFNNYISNNYKIIALIITNLISLIVSVTILLGNKKMESKIAWTIFVLFVPIVGFLFYMILGVEYSRFSKFDDKPFLDDDIDKLTLDDKENIHKIISKLGDRKDAVKLIHKINNSPVSINSKVEIMTNGDMKYKHLLEELKKAKMFIHFEYFIIKESEIFDQIKEILIERSNSGVEVRFLYDDFGCMDFPKTIIKELIKNGIKVGCFNKIDFKLFRPSINYRNHRKIVVIDNKVGFVGGINIGDEYNHKDPYYGFWRDTHLLVRGMAVKNLNVVFIKDWYHTTDELLTQSKYINSHAINNSKSAIQIVADGPDNPRGLIRNTFFKLINEANKRVWIVTPYLILDNELLVSLRVAALSGVDVRIIVPGIHDKGKKMVYKATEAYFNDLLEAGVKIYKYNDRFIHSKVMIIDDDIASVGTVNFDYRSFDLHFEITAILYFDPAIDQLIDEYKEDLSNSTQVMYNNWKKRSFNQRMIESLVKIFSPLL